MAFPTTVLVDKDGNIVGEPFMGGIDDQSNYDQLMKQIQSGTGPEIIYINILVRGQLLFAVTAPRKPDKQIYFTYQGSKRNYARQHRVQKPISFSYRFV